METSTLSAIISTVLPFITFIGIVAWAWSRRRTAAFRDAADAPFALPDEDVRPAPVAASRGTSR